MNLFPKNILGALRNIGTVHANPSRDWLLVLGVGALALAASVIWNIWFFDRTVTKGIETLPNPSAVPSAYEPTAVQEIFEARATTSAAYRTLYPFIDPSR